jgi:hypothetical protein
MVRYEVQLQCEIVALNLLIPVHDTFKLGIERILPLLDNPPTDDLHNFVGYCETWADGLVGHHDSEG